MNIHLRWAVASVLLCVATAVLFNRGVGISAVSRDAAVCVSIAGNPDDGSAALRVFNVTDGRLLMAVERGSSCEISPDSRWIAVADATGSDCTQFRLFRRQGGLEYVEEAIPEPWSALKQLRRIDCADCDHQYVVPIRWLDHETLEVMFNAHGCGRDSADDASLFYHVGRREWRVTEPALRD